MNAQQLEDILRAAIQDESAKLYVAYTPSNHRGVSCSVDACPNLAYAKGLCNAHYLRARSGKPLSDPLQHRVRRTQCIECSEPVDVKGGWGLCKPHYRLRRRNIIRRLCIAALGDKCQRCGGVFQDCVYDFHHRSSDTKIDDPSRMISGLSLALIAEEVLKCDLLCANCHRIEHNGRVELREIAFSCTEA